MFWFTGSWVTIGMTDHRDLTEHAHALSEHAQTILEAAQRALPNLENLSFHRSRRPRTGRRLILAAIVFAGAALAVVATRRWRSPVGESSLGASTQSTHDARPGADAEATQPTVPAHAAV